MNVVGNCLASAAIDQLVAPAAEAAARIAAACVRKSAQLLSAPYVLARYEHCTWPWFLVCVRLVGCVRTSLTNSGSNTQNDMGLAFGVYFRPCAR
jgi:hypothetical protein